MSGEKHPSVGTDTPRPGRKKSASNPFNPRRGPDSTRERILLALGLGRRAQFLRKLGKEASSLKPIDGEAAEPGEGAIVPAPPRESCRDM
jgi:hypothetical protein